jgi:hypothetical protein
MRLLLLSIFISLMLALPVLFSLKLLPNLPVTIGQKYNAIVDVITPPSPLPVDADSLTILINQIRHQNQVGSLLQGQKTCLLAETALTHQNLDPQIIAQKCPECCSVQIARLSQPLDLDWFQRQIGLDASTSAYLLDPDLTHLCVATSAAQVVISLVTAKPKAEIYPLPTPASFTEDQLWQALIIYRQSQNRSTLKKDDKLCLYARKRVNDHLDLYNQKLDPALYPVESKYPLDAHQGFKQDAESGLVFDMTQKNQVAENLAYWPNAADPIHVIEWGWDTSTEGHREAQLSNDWTHGCISGKSGFYVAIFAK